MEKTKISMNDSKIKYQGRIELEDGLPLFTFPMTSLEFNFIGTYIEIEITNYRWIRNNYMGVIIDGVQTKFELIHENDKKTYIVATDLSNKEHNVKIFKRMDSAHYVKIHSITIDGELTKRPEDEKLKIEVYGDSISAGSVVEAVGFEGKDDPEHDGEYSNAFYSYGNLTAQKLNAQIHDIAQGGIALMDGTGNFHGLEIGMESTYDKVKYNPHLGNVTTWDFSKYTPDIVIIALGQNCKKPVELMEDIESELASKWREHYIAFVKKLRAHYNDALIILQTSVMTHNENYDKSISRIVESLNDDKVCQIIFDGNGSTTDGHPRIQEHEKMSDELIKLISSKCY